MKKLLTLTLVVVFVLGLIGGVALAGEPCERQEQGYWKGWLAQKAEDEPGWTCDMGLSAEKLLGFLNTPARGGNANVILSYQFIAAALNVGVNGCELPVGTGCDGNDVLAAFLAARGHMAAYLQGEDSGASRQDILGWKDILELWNKGYDPGFYLWERHDDADPYSGLCAEQSYATFEDEGDGTGTLTVYLFDMYGCPITENAATGAPLPNNTFRANSDSKTNDYFFYIGGAHFNEPAYPGFSSSNALQVEPGVYELALSSVCAYDQMWEIGIGSWLLRSQVIPIDMVNIDIACPNLGVVNAANSSATWTDNEDGTGTMYLTVQDCCGNGIDGLGMLDIEIDLPLVGLIKSLAQLKSESYWDVALYEAENGLYEAIFTRLGSIPYTRTWGVIVNEVNIGDVDVKVSLEAVLQSVVYEGDGNLFGDNIDDKITFTFSNDVFHDPSVEVTFKFAQELWEGWGADNWILDGNTATVTLNRLYGSPRDIVGDKVVDITGLIDAIGNTVVVPEDGVVVTQQ